MKQGNGFQKIFGYILLGLVGWGVIKVLNKVMPDINILIHNTWQLILWGGPLAILTVYVVSNWSLITGVFTTLSCKLTSWIIKQDPLSVMDRYADLLSRKLRNVLKTIVVLKGQKAKLERLIESQTTFMNDQIKKGVAAKQEGSTNVAIIAGNRATGAKQSIQLYQPNLERTKRSLEFLEKMAENWDMSIIQLRETTERKREEWTTLKENAKALKQSEAFLRGDTPEGQLYKESLKALEEKVTQSIGYIEDFEQRAKPIMEGAAVSKRMNDNEGMAIIDEFMNSNKLMMPDFSIGAETIPYTNIPKEFNLLKK